MSSGPPDLGGAALSAPIPPETRRWLHDKYERLASEEGQLATGRTSYYAAIGTVLVTGLVVAIADFSSQRGILALVATFLGSLGILISVVWAVLLHRTNDAQAMWRQSALQLEETDSPVEGTLPGSITLRSTRVVNVNLLRPYQAHRARFSNDKAISWMDRVDPARLTEILPVVFVVLWVSVLLFAWFWYFFG